VRQIHKPRLRGLETDIEHELASDKHAIQLDGGRLTRQVTKVTSQRARGLGFLITGSDQQVANVAETHGLYQTARYGIIAVLPGVLPTTCSFPGRRNGLLCG
jgi:hypothetical protein